MKVKGEEFTTLFCLEELRFALKELYTTIDT